MRRVHDEQTYLDFSEDTSLEEMRDYRAKYAWRRARRTAGENHAQAQGFLSQVSRRDQRRNRLPRMTR